MSGAFETQAYMVLTFAAIALLLLVTSGVAYLTAVEWRDRRRRDKEQPVRRSKAKAGK